MSLEYEFALRIPLASDAPLTSWLCGVLQGERQGDAPDLVTSELTTEQLVAWIDAAAADQQLRLVGDDANSLHLEWSGSLPDAQFYVDFLPLLEWLARSGAINGWVGTYHVRSLLHPTLVYFASGRPYSLQVTGMPLGMADGEALPPQALDALQDAPDDELSDEDFADDVGDA